MEATKKGKDKILWQQILASAPEYFFDKYRDEAKSGNLIKLEFERHLPGPTKDRNHIRKWLGGLYHDGTCLPTPTGPPEEGDLPG